MSTACTTIPINICDRIVNIKQIQVAVKVELNGKHKAHSVHQIIYIIYADISENLTYRRPRHLHCVVTMGCSAI